MKQTYLIHDTLLNRWFRTTAGFASPTAETVGDASLYRKTQAEMLCQFAYGNNYSSRATIEKADKAVQSRWAARLGGMKKSTSKTLAVRKNAKLPRRRKARLL